MSRDDDFEGMDGPDDFDSPRAVEAGGGAGARLADAWRTQPAFKWIVILFVGIVGVALFFAFAGGGSDQVERSFGLQAGSVDELPGEGGLSPQMEEAIREKNRQDAEQAAQTGQTFLPAPFATGESADVEAEPEPQLQDVEAIDPLEEWRRRAREEEERLLAEIQQQPAPEPQVQSQDARAASAQEAEIVQNLTDNILRQMSEILDTRAEIPMQLYGSPVSEDEREATLEADGVDVAGLTGGGGGRDEGPILIPAGEIEYAQMLTTANSDVRAPVLAMILSGDFSGARILGSFQATEDYLVLTFNTMVHEGEEYEIEAVALDPDTTLAGVATEVNRRYLTRVVLPAAAEFITGFADALAETQTTVTVTGDIAVQEENELDDSEAIAAGIADAGESIADVLDEMGQRAPTVIVDAGTPLGVLFTTSLREERNNGRMTTDEAMDAAAEGTN